MTFFAFSAPSMSQPAGQISTLRLPRIITARTGCALPFLPLPTADLPATATANAPSASPQRRSGHDVHQGSYYAQCRVAMGY